MLLNPDLHYLASAGSENEKFETSSSLSDQRSLLTRKTENRENRENRKQKTEKTENRKKNLLEFERPEIFVDEKRANGVGKNWAEHLQVLRFYPTLKMTAAWWEFSIFLTNLFFSLHVTLSYQVPQKFSRLCQAGEYCPHRPSAQP